MGAKHEEIETSQSRQAILLHMVAVLHSTEQGITAGAENHLE
jgi:hypothetical protein